MKKIALFPSLFIAMAGMSQTKSSNVEFANPSSVASPKGYSHAAIIDLGNYKMIIMSGQVAFDKQGNLIGKDDVKKQTEQVFLNIKSIVEELGGSMNNIIKLSYFLTDVTKIQTIRSVRDEFINIKSPPASTLLEVSKLFRDDLLIEIEATAIIAKN
jgi:2-iminobutanoate/2-iminopropanoate deaminase